jgi:hypothetical protein
VITGTPTTCHEEVRHLVVPSQTGWLTVNDDAVEVVIDERYQFAEQLGE